MANVTSQESPHTAFPISLHNQLIIKESHSLNCLHDIDGGHTHITLIAAPVFGSKDILTDKVFIYDAYMASITVVSEHLLM